MLQAWEKVTVLKLFLTGHKVATCTVEKQVHCIAHLMILYSDRLYAFFALSLHHLALYPSTLPPGYPIPFIYKVTVYTFIIIYSHTLCFLVFISRAGQYINIDILFTIFDYCRHNTCISWFIWLSHHLTH